MLYAFIQLYYCVKFVEVMFLAKLNNYLVA